MPQPWEKEYAPPKSLVEQARNSQFAQNVVESGKNFFGGIWDAVTSPKQTGEAVLNLTGGALQKLSPGGPYPLEPYADAVGQMYRNRYGSPGAAVNTLYTDPVGAAADLSMFAGAGAGALRGVQGAASLAGMTRAANAARTGANILNTASAVSDPVRLAAQLPLLPSRLSGLPERLYQSALKPGPGTYTTKEVKKMVGTGLREGFTVSEEGVRRLYDLVSDLHQKQTGIIDAGTQAGVTIDPARVAQRVEDIRPGFRQQVNPEHDMSLLDRSKAEFLRQYEIRAPYTQVMPNPYGPQGGYVATGQGYTSIPVPIPASEAQAVKSGTYRSLKDKAYGELKGAEIEAQKALARGIREELVSAFPEIGSLSAREAASMGLSTALEHAVRRGANHQLFGIGTPLAVGAAADVTGSGAMAAVLGGLRGIIDNPQVKSRLAIAIKRAQAANPKRFRPASTATALERIDAYRDALGRYLEPAAVSAR